VLEDWIWHTGLPTLAYASLLYAGITLLRGSLDAQYFAGGSALLLVFIGIHNAWDTVMYITAREQEHNAKKSAQARNTESTPTASDGPRSRPAESRSGNPSTS